MKKQLLSICVWLCVIFTNNQSFSQINFALPDSLMRSGEYVLASAEYERIIRSTLDKDLKTIAQIKRAEAIYFSGDVSRAAHYLKRIPLIFVKDSLKAEIRFRQTSFYYQSNDFENALALVESHIRDSSSFAFSNLGDWYELGIMIANELAYYSRALDFVDSLKVYASDIKPAYSLEKLESRYNLENLPRLRNPKKVALASNIVPGLGHTISGYPHEGLWNFTLVFASLGYGVFNFLNQNYVTSILAGGGLAQKFYFGGVVRSEYLANKSNHQKVRRFADDVKKILSERTGV